MKIPANHTSARSSKILIMKKTILALALAAGLTSFAGTAKAQTTSQTFGSNGNTFTLDFQTIGNAGNAADTTGYGAVNYNYSMAPTTSR